MRIISLIIPGIICLSLYRCKTEEIILHGEIAGLISDYSTDDPINGALVILYPSNDSIRTGDDGKYLFKNLIPGNYEVEVSKFGFMSTQKQVRVVSMEIQEMNIPLINIPLPNISDTGLDFGTDLTILKFTIKKIGSGSLNYFLNPSKTWITVDPFTGELTDETDTITVAINRAAISDQSYIEVLTLASFTPGGKIPEYFIDVYVNRLYDVRDGEYYNTVKIGTQLWMSENLKIGTNISGNTSQTDNGIIEKYYYQNDENIGKIYGGLYQWDEAMQYNPADYNPIGTTQGICPIGWHLPTRYEVGILMNYLGGEDVAGGKLKEKGTLEQGTGYWLSPNLGATNESGFSGRPGGHMFNNSSSFEGLKGLWWLSSINAEAELPQLLQIQNNARGGTVGTGTKTDALSVRCVKNP